MQWAMAAMLAVALGAPADAKGDTCAVRAFAASSADLAVHAQPSAASPVLKMVPAEFAELDLREMRDGWFRVAAIADAESDQPLFTGKGWVRASALAMDVSGSGNRRLYSEPSESGTGIPLAQTGGEPVELIDCAADWAKVRFGGQSGWLAPSGQCSSALTTCS